VAGCYNFEPNILKEEIKNFKAVIVKVCVHMGWMINTSEFKKTLLSYTAAATILLSFVFNMQS